MANRQVVRAVSHDLLERLARAGEAAQALILARYLQRVNPPEAVSVALLDDREIARVHGHFLNDPGPTDVITFPYGSSGEILISVETAARQALEYGGSWERELALYLVHGLLHLSGYDDRDEEGRRTMEELQEAVLSAVWEDRAERAT